MQTFQLCLATTAYCGHAIHLQLLYLMIKQLLYLMIKHLTIIILNDKTFEMSLATRTCINNDDILLT